MKKAISNQIKKDVLNMYNCGISQTKIAAVYGISRRSVGRIINTESKEIHYRLIPLVNIPLMSDEKFQQIAAEQKRQRETDENSGTEALE